MPDILELFDQIDVDFSGEVDWGEFSAFCIEFGSAAASDARVKAPVTTFYARR